MRKIILTTVAALVGAASLSACSSMANGSRSASTPSATNAAAVTPDSNSQTAPSPQDSPR
jgi:hypothetical protein